MILKEHLESGVVAVVQDKFDQKGLKNGLLGDVVFDQRMEELNNHRGNVLGAESLVSSSRSSSNHLFEDLNHFVLKDYDFTT